jgi:hypothetical protein
VAELVSAPGGLDLDDVCTHVGQDHGCQWAGEKVAEVDDAHALQRMGCTWLACVVGGKV